MTCGCGESVSVSGEGSIVGTRPQCSHEHCGNVPSTNVSHLTSRANRFTDMHVSLSTVHLQLLAHFSMPRVVRQLLSTGKSVGKAMFPHVVCQAEWCLSVLFRSFISPHICVLLHTYATAKIEMAQAWRSKHANLGSSISLSQNLVNTMEGRGRNTEDLLLAWWRWQGGIHVATRAVESKHRACG